MEKGNGDSHKQINIEIDDEVSRGIYSNFSVVSHSETEFIMDFAFLFPLQQKNKIRARIISSPASAKKFLLALTENVKKYEEQHGPIPT